MSQISKLKVGNKTDTKLRNREIKYLKKEEWHKKLTTTQIYSNLAPEQVREAYERE